MEINGKQIGDCYVVAEIGHNHQGNLQRALELIKVAKDCGVDAVKFQKRDNLSLYTNELYNQPYDNENSFGKTYGEHREKLEFGKDEYIQLIQYADELDITLFATAFDFKSAVFLEELDMPAFKIASGDLTNTPLLEYIAEFGKPMIVSTGGGTLDDVQRAYDTVMQINPQLVLMQCTASYPSEPEEMNLRVIESYRLLFPDAIIGLSDHQNGISMAILGYMLGARVIEKHFTLNHSWKGTDQAFSLEPVGMRKLVRDLRRIKPALGDGVKKPYESERNGLFKMGKKLVADCDLPEGHTVRREDIAIKSPNDGLPPYMINSIIGKILTKPMVKDETFER